MIRSTMRVWVKGKRGVKETHLPAGLWDAQLPMISLAIGLARWPAYQRLQRHLSLIWINFVNCMAGALRE
jgi:hypothetical protein